MSEYLFTSKITSQSRKFNAPAMTVTVDGRVYNFHSNSITIEYSDILASAAADTGNVVVDGLSIPWRVF